MDANIINTLVQKEVNLCILHHKEEKEITTLQKTKVDVLFDLVS
jgi:hypothetical protein